jgi:hypothetical protein
MATVKLTTKQAQERAGVSRHALMRAKKKSLLWAETDNHGNLLWDNDALEKWAKERPEILTVGQSTPNAVTKPEVWEAIVDARERAARAEGERDGLRVALHAATARAEAAEARATAAEHRRRWWHL